MTSNSGNKRNRTQYHVGRVVPSKKLEHKWIFYDAFRLLAALKIIFVLFSKGRPGLVLIGRYHCLPAQN